MIAMLRAAPLLVAALVTQDPGPHPAPAAPLGRTRPADGTSKFAMQRQASADSAPQPFGIRTVTQATFDSAGQRFVRRVIVLDYGARGQVVDSTLSVAKTLAPILERTYTRSRIIFYDFAGQTVTGAMGPAASPRAIHDTLGAPAFNSTDLDLVVQSLALKAGLRTQVALYDPEEAGGYRMAEIAVEGPSPATTASGSRQAWLVRVHERQADLDFRIDRDTRALLSANIRPKSGVQFIYKRDSPPI